MSTWSLTEMTMMTDPKTIEQIDEEIIELEKRINALRNARWEIERKNKAYYLGWTDTGYEDPEYGGIHYVYLGYMTAEQAKEIVDDAGYDGFTEVTYDQISALRGLEALQKIQCAARNLGDSCVLKVSGIDSIIEASEKIFDEINEQIQKLGFYRIGVYDTVQMINGEE